MEFYELPTIMQMLHSGIASGLYYIRAKSEDVICSLSQELFAEYLVRTGSPDSLVIYIGKATNLRKRLQQELYHTGPGTFFRSLGAVMGKNPLRATTESGVRNYCFGEPTKSQIISFIENNLEVAIEFIDIDKEPLEIKKYQPLLNVRYNPNPVVLVQQARRRCQDFAARDLRLSI